MCFYSYFLYFLLILTQYLNGISVKSQYIVILSYRICFIRYTEMNYIQRIRALREDNDLNQTKIASILHIAQTTYSDYEKGKVRIPLEYLIELARFYDVDLNYIAGISNIKNRFPRK